MIRGFGVEVREGTDSGTLAGSFCGWETWMTGMTA
jgi:hypothetical protein